MHFLKEHHSGIQKQDIFTKEGVGNQNDDEDIDEPQDILEDIDIDNEDDRFFRIRALN